jgi:hypothetical protein
MLSRSDCLNDLGMMFGHTLGAFCHHTPTRGTYKPQLHAPHTDPESPLPEKLLHQALYCKRIKQIRIGALTCLSRASISLTLAAASPAGGGAMLAQAASLLGPALGPMLCTGMADKP